MSRIDDFGPYTCQQLREIAQQIHEFHPPYQQPDVIRACDGPGEITKIIENLHNGRPCIVLWRQTPEYGHFIALLRRGACLELFDPLGGESHGGLQKYLQPPMGPFSRSLNGGDWIRRIFEHWADSGGRCEYNSAGPQHHRAESCGLWCLTRTVHKHLQPAVFARKFAGK